MTKIDMNALLAEFGNTDTTQLAAAYDEGMRSSREKEYKIENGRTEFILVPPPAAEGLKVPWIVRFQHFLMLKGQKEGRSVHDCPRMHARKPCPTCSLQQKFAASGAAADETVARQLEAGKGFVGWARLLSVPQGAPPENVVKLAFGQKVWKGIMALIEDGALIGRVPQSTVIVVRKTDNDITVSARPNPVDTFPSTEAMREALDTMQAAPLSSLVQVRSMPELERLGAAFLAGAAIQLPKPAHTTVARLPSGARPSTPTRQPSASADAIVDAEFEASSDDDLNF